MFWLRTLSSKLILAMAVLCLLATSLAFFARAYWEFLGAWWLAAVWWFAFSAGLWYFDTHGDVLRTGRKIPANRET
jgi:small-conductance mechanosensitive channel